MPKNTGNPKGGKHASRGSNAEGPNSNNVRGKGGRKAQRGGDGGAGSNAPNPAGIGVINRMNKSTHHTTS